MKRMFAILAFLCVLGAGQYVVVSKFAIRHEVVTLFDAARQRPISVEIAEEAGFDALSVPDHLQQNRVGGGPDSPMFEAYTLLGEIGRAHV